MSYRLSSGGDTAWDPSWDFFFVEQQQKLYFAELQAFLQQESAEGFCIYPERNAVFRAFQVTPFESIKVVVLGQDPYHQPGQAHGLCFSVQRGVKLPGSLRNIFKELKSDLGVVPREEGCLECWAKQGVFLINSVLTVRRGEAHAHAGRGWEIFTDAAVRIISERLRGVVFLLWGGPAQKKQELIDFTRHHVLKAAHPSPLSAYRGFLGCRHFSQTNELLRAMGRGEVDWGS